MSVPTLDGQDHQLQIASEFGSQTQIAALFAVLTYRTAELQSPIARFESQFKSQRYWGHECAFLIASDSSFGSRDFAHLKSLS